jgi:predicted unusual protein kinase regulating ubiquinone biosynthesis (AarF/ABC1/UbiB family)
MSYFLKKITFYSFIARIYYVNVMYSGPKRHILVGKLMKSYSETLGPTFIKICQTLVYRNDLLPQQTLDELKPLLNKCIPEKNLENKIKTTFLNVSNIKLIGSGTIAQVYSGYLENKKYAFKVRRTNIENQMKQDIIFLEEWLSLIHKWYPYCNILKRFDIIKKSVDYILSLKN